MLEAGKRHPGYSWLDEQHVDGLDEVSAAQWMEQLEEYRAALDEHVRQLDAWKRDRLIRMRALSAAQRQLAQARVAESTGLTLGGAIPAAVAAAAAAYEQAAAEAAQLSDKPAAPRKPRRPKKGTAATGSRVLQPHGTNACRARGCDRPECIEAGRAYYREWLANRRRQKIPAEIHGSAYGYQLGCHDRDACPAEISCADASLAEERRRRRAAGIPEQAPRVPADPVREHVRALMAAGMALYTIATTAEVSMSGLKTLLYGRSGARKGEYPTTIEQRKAERVLALPLPHTRAKTA
ncbi:hypothetical protein E4U02_07660 [Microbacterium paludicola]|uniref:Uncharacterized protein n=1 Tax=Microbacterium paludicola TaxID=300019 RepID=A0A4Y9FWX2_9MICO|nr:hypothetical protein [Microbacterium paludicola]MBF0816284.1 hypothetical protein [Microbacterium paludicola]TFU33083.1 hypothetical protein E4U02_07660 [Microbacterium paludicola]